MTPASHSLKLGLALFGGGSRGAVEVGPLAELNIKILDRCLFDRRPKWRIHSVRFPCGSASGSVEENPVQESVQKIYSKSDPEI